MNYILHYDYSALGIMVFTLYYLIMRKDLKRRDNKVLLVLTLMNIFSAIADIVAIKVQSDIPRFGTGPGTFWNMAYLIVHTQMGLVLVIYVIELLGIRDRVTKLRWAVMLAPSAVVLTVLALNPFLGWYFYYNEQNIYSYGPMTPVVFGGPFVQLGILLILVIKFREVMPRNMLLSLSMFLLLTMAAVAIQHQFREYLIELYVQSIGLLGIMLAVENKDEIRTLVNAMDDLERERQRAEKANRYKSDFLANMSHEIRTPINAVLGMDEMLLREVAHAQDIPPQTSDEVRQTFLKVQGYAYDIRSAGQNLLSIINDILDFSKIESGKMELSEAEYRLGSVLNDVSNMIAFRARTKHLEFDVDVDESMPDAYIGDEVRVRQVLTNLLTNAVKYTQEGSVTLTVREEKGQLAATGRESGFALLKFIVTDTGIGIREADRKRLFDKFERVDLQKNNTIEGTGLGLAITKSLVDMMHGSVSVESEYGKGSTFTLTIPQQVTDDKPIGNFREAFDAAHRQEEVYQETFRAPDARILVVDDTAVNLTVFKGLIADTLVKVNTASSGAQALEMTQDIPFDVIFMDQRMPGMDGTQTLKGIRAQRNSANPDTPVISLTADAVQGARDRYLSEGFVDYLSKPVDGLQLEAMLMKYLPEEKVERVEKRGVAASPAIMPAATQAAPSAAAGSSPVAGLTPDEARTEIEDTTPALLEQYRALEQMIAQILDLPAEGEQADKPEIDAEELQELYNAVLEFAEGYDIDSIDALLKQAEEYRIPYEEQERYDTLVRCVRNSDWERLKEVLTD